MSFFNNNRLLSVITLLLLTANIATLGYLWTHKNNNSNAAIQLPPPPASGQVFEFITKELQLDTVQQNAYKLLREEHQAGQRPLQDSIRKVKDNFFELLKQQNTPDTLVQTQNSKVAMAQQQLELFTFKHFQKLRAICNAEQQKKFDTIIQDVLRRMASGKMPQGPPPGMQGNRPSPGEGPGGRKPPPPVPEGEMPPPPKNSKY